MPCVKSYSRRWVCEVTISGSVTITKLDHRGRPVLSYPGKVVYSDDEVTVARCPWPSADSFDLGPICLEPGDIFVEFYYHNEWFNIFQIHCAAGLLKGWYCNITAPVRISDSEIRWQDLALDLLVLPDGERVLLDEREFRALQLPASMRASAEDALATLRQWLDQGRTPFPRF